MMFGTERKKNEQKTLSKRCQPEQFEHIRSMLESARHKTRPRRVDLYDIFCTILYLLKNTSIWRALPSDFPSISTVRTYFDQWSRQPAGEESSLLAQALKKSGGAGTGTQRACQLDDFLYHGRAKRQEYDTARNKGYDAGKKVSGIKRHIAVDTQGLPQAIGVTTAEVTDRAGDLTMFSQHRQALSKGARCWPTLVATQARRLPKASGSY